MKREEINIRDPFVLTRNGQYYLYGTRGATCWGPADGFDVYVSRDLENWDGPFECFHNDGTFWADRNYWAPEVHEYHGKLYMLASFKREDLCRGTAILTADNPLGPFVPHSDGRVTPPIGSALTGRFTSARTTNRISSLRTSGCRSATAKSAPCPSPMTFPAPSANRNCSSMRPKRNGRGWCITVPAGATAM